MQESLYEKKRNKILEYCIYWLFVILSLNRIITYITNIENVHILYMVFLGGSIFFLNIHNKEVKLESYYIPIFIYIIIVIFGIFSSNNQFFYAIRVGSYRIVFPLLFIIIFSNKDIYKNLNKISNNIVKVIFVTSLVIGLFGVVEYFYPDTIYSIYKGNITPHTTLIIDNETVRRILSISGNPINLGFQMVFGLLSSITLIYQYKRKSIFIVILCVFSLIIFSSILILTYSRAALMVGFVVVTTMIVLMMITNYRSEKYKPKNLALVLAIIGIALILIILLLVQIDGFTTRVASINLQAYFSNTRFLRALNAFNKDTSLFNYIFGHGIYQINDSSSYVFELGYASLFFESGLIGFVSLLGTYIYSMYIAIKNIMSFHYEDMAFINNLFYFTVLVGGLVAMIVEDIYMQQPFSIYIWISSIYILKSNREPTFKENYSGIIRRS